MQGLLARLNLHSQGLLTLQSLLMCMDLGPSRSAFSCGHMMVLWWHPVSQALNILRITY